VVGAFAGAVFGVVVSLSILFLGYPRGTPIHPPMLALVFLGGMAAGATLGIAFGNRPVPIFWLFFVLVFGGIAIIGATDPHACRECLPFFLLPQTIFSLALASVFTLVHSALVGNRNEATPPISPEVLTVAQEWFNRSDNDHIAANREEVKSAGEVRA
jgi:hypothetical protein